MSIFKFDTGRLTRDTGVKGIPDPSPLLLFLEGAYPMIS